MCRLYFVSNISGPELTDMTPVYQLGRLLAFAGLTISFRSVFSTRCCFASMSEVNDAGQTGVTDVAHLNWFPR